jgi:hypothetical protein
MTTKPIITFASVAVLGLASACSGSPVTTTSSQFYRADMNHDGNLNIAEYHALFDIQAQDGYPLAKEIVKGDPHSAENKIQGRFDYLDTNHNRLLSKEELAVSKD